MKLISMTEFVISRWDENITSDHFAQNILKYARFLRQPLTLSMFIPCDEDNNPLEEPNPEHYGYLEGYGFEGQHSESLYAVDFRKYKQAKQSVLFEWCSIVYSDINPDSFFIVNQNGAKIGFYKSLPKYFEWNAKTIEGLTPYDLTLTEQAIKQIGL